jgi:hypothetical protein
MPHYQSLLFGCANPRAGLADRNPMNDAELIWDWIERLAGAGRMQLDWPASVRTLAPLVSDSLDQDDILGVVVAISHPLARPLDHHVALLGDCLPEHAGPRMLTELCLPLSADIQTAMFQWEIARFAARGIGLDLPAGRLFLVEGWYDQPPAS